MKRRVLISLISLLLIFTIFSSMAVSASAAGVEQTVVGYMQDTSDPNSGELRWEYIYSDSTKTARLRISGDGYMPNSTDDSWFEAQINAGYYITEVVIEEGVRSIMENAFAGEIKLQKVTLPSTIEFIGDGAFADTPLKKFHIPAGVNNVNANIFSGSPIEAFTVSSDNPYYKAYNGNVYSKNMTELVLVAPNNNLYNFSFPKTVTSIGRYAFSGCAIKSITIPSHVKSIKNMAFAGCTDLQELVVHNGVAEIYDSAFLACDSLKNVQLPSSVNYLGYCALGYTYGPDFAALEEMLDYKGISHSSINESNFVYYAEQTGFGPESFISCYVDESFNLYAPLGSAGENYAKNFGLNYIRSTGFLSAVSTRDGVLIKWSEPYEAYHYNIYRKVDGEWKLIPDLSSDCTEYLDRDVVGNSDNTYAIEVYYWSGYKYFDKGGITCHYVETPVLKSVANKVGGVNVSWYPVDGVVRYFIYRKQPGDKSWTKLGYISADKTSYFDKKAQSGKYYYFTVIAHDGKAASSYDPVGRGLTYVATPQFNVYNTQSGVTIKWNAVKNAESYRVYRKTASTSWALLKEVDAGKTAYADKTAKRGNTYIYTVRAVSNSTYSAYESSGTAIRSLATPTVKLTNVGAGVKVSWNKCAGASGYYVYRKNSSGSWTRIAKVSGGSTLYYVDKNAKNAQKYTYTVKSINGSYTSSYNSDGETILFLKTPKISSVKSTRSGVSLKYNTIGGAKGYYIYRKTTNGNWVLVGNVKNGATSTFVDKTAKKGATYIYTVRAYNGSVRSSYYSSGIKVKVVY